MIRVPCLLFAGGRSRLVAGAGKSLMMWEALREATDEEMERDPTVCVMGKRAIGC